MELSKVDFLFLLIGTNPLPNLISAFTSIKSGTTIYLCYTRDNNGLSDTESIAKELKRLLEEKQEKSNTIKGLNIILVVINKSNINEVKVEFRNHLENIQSNVESKNVIELNYTGGTKVMSAGAYHAFKEFAKLDNKCENFKFVTSYIDGEKEEICYEVIEKEKEKYWIENLSKIDSIFEIKIDDIISLHERHIKNNYKVVPFDAELGEKIFNLFIGCDNEEYLNHIKWLENVELECRNKAKDKDWNVLNYYDKNNINIMDGLKEKVNSSSNKEMELYKKILKGTWLEEYCFKILLELREEGYIDNVVNSVNGEKKDEFEIDLIAYRNYKLFCISLSSVDDKEQELAKHKLFEIKERARQLGGSDAGVCLITLNRDSKILEEEIKNVWDRDVNRNVLIIGVDKFENIKEEMKEWIRRRADE